MARLSSSGERQNAPLNKRGRFFRWLLAVAFVYVLLVVGHMGWVLSFSTFPQGYALGFNMAPFGPQLQAPVTTWAVGADKLEARGVAHTLPLLTPWQAVTVADALGWYEAGNAVPVVEVFGTTLTNRADGLFVAQANSGKWADSTAENIAVTYDAAWLDFLQRPQRMNLAVQKITLMTAGLSQSLSLENMTLAALAQPRLPNHHDRAAVSTWQAAGGRVAVDELRMSMLGMDFNLAGELVLDTALLPKGDFQLQLNGLGDGYAQLGVMGIIPPNQYRLLGYLLQAMPAAKQQTFTLPLKIEKHKIFIGPAAALAFGPLPWEKE